MFSASSSLTWAAVGLPDSRSLRKGCIVNPPMPCYLLLKSSKGLSSLKTTWRQAFARTYRYPVAVSSILASGVVSRVSRPLPKVRISAHGSRREQLGSFPVHDLPTLKGLPFATTLPIRLLASSHQPRRYRFH